MSDTATYDFIVNDDNEVMLLLYAGESKPDKARLSIDSDNLSAELMRNDKDSVVLEDVPMDILAILLDSDTLMVCELSQTENDDDSEIVYAYEAEITD